jgi:hypothetical protein
MRHLTPPFRKLLITLLAPALLALPGCYSYRLATKAQPSTDQLKTTKIHTSSLFWGLVNKPQVIHTPNCDAMDVLGVSEVQIRTNLGYVLLTVATLGIYCPMTIYWKCSKPCLQTDSL